MSLAGVSAAAGCADVQPALYDAGAISPVSTVPSSPSSDAGTDDANGSVALDGSTPGPNPDGSATPPATDLDSWRALTLYLAIPDRFANGDASNDASGTPSCLDPTSATKFHGGDIAGIRQHVAHLADLGVGALWITPQYKQDPTRCGYHGYWADFVDPDDAAMEPKMGTPADLTGLAGDLHGAGIRLVLDMVVNHSGKNARVTKQHPDWFHTTPGCSSLGDPNVYCPLNAGLPDFAQENPAVASYLNGVSTGWATRFPIDGIRMDTVKNVPVSYWKSSWVPAVQAARPGIFTVGEVFDESGAAALLPYLDAGFDSLFDYPRYGALVSTFAQGGSVDAVADKVKDAITTYGLARALRMTSMVGNHDNPRFTSLVPTGTAESEIVARFHLALGAIFTLPGMPELYYGDEIAMYGAADPDNRRDMPSWAWTEAGRSIAHAGEAAGVPQDTYAFVKALTHLRASHPALYAGAYGESWRQNGSATNVYAFYRSSGNDRIVVAINNGAASATVALPTGTTHAIPALPDGTNFTDALGSGTVAIANGALSVTLPAKTMGIYVAN